MGYVITLEKVNVVSVEVNVEGREIPRDDLASLQNLYGLAPEVLKSKKIYNRKFEYVPVLFTFFPFPLHFVFHF